jgi:hypothetical protein
LSYGEAKLYGVIDENGEIKPRASNVIKADEKKKIKNHSDLLATVKEKPKISLDDPDIKESTFKPIKSDASMKAMLNKKCGYDFFR